MTSRPENTSTEKEAKELAKGSAVYLVGIGLEAVFGFGTALVLARALGVSTYGLFALGATVSLFTVSFAQCGLGQGTVRYVARYQGLGRPDLARRAFFTALGWVVVLAGLIGGAQWLLAGKLGRGLFEEPGSVIYIRWLSLVVVAGACLAVLLGGLRGLKESAAFVLVRNVCQPAAGLAAFLAALFLGHKIFGALFFRTIGAAAAIFLGWVYLRRRLPRVSSGREEQARKSLSRQLLGYSWPLSFSDFGFRVSAHIDLFMLGVLATAGQVGLYRVAAVLGLFSQKFLDGFSLMAGPMFSDLHHRQDLVGLQAVFQKATKWATIIALPVIAGGVCFPRYLLGVFGREFVAGSGALVLLAASQLVNLATGPAAGVLVMSGRSRLHLINAWLGGGLNAVLNYLLIPVLGIIGAALATAISRLVINALLAFEVMATPAVHPFSPGLLKVVLAAGLVFGPAGWMANQVWPGDLAAGLSVLGAASVLYALAVHRFCLDEEDYAVVKAFLRKAGFSQAEPESEAF